MDNQPNPPATFESEMEVFLKTAGGGQSQYTALTYRTGLTYFKTYLEQTQGWKADQPIAALQPDVVQEFPVWLLKQTYQRSKNGPRLLLAESTRSLYILAVTRFLRFLVLRKRLSLFDYAEYNRIKEELASATNVKSKPVEQKIPAQELVDALVEAAQTPPDLKSDASPTYRHRLTLLWRRNLAVVLALKSSGMRVGELVKLKRSDLDFGRQGAWVTGKGRKTRFVAFDDPAWSAIQAYLADRQDESLPGQVTVHPLFCRHDRSVLLETRHPLSVRTIQRVVEALAEQADIARRFNLSPHSLRHFFANRLLQFTGKLALVQDALGHEDPKTTRRYTKVSVDEIAQSVQAMAKEDEDDTI